MTINEVNIYQRLHAIMQDVGYIQKENKKVNNQYTFVSHDAVTAKMRKSFLKHGVMAVPNFFDISQDGNKTMCSVGFVFINIEKPEDRVTVDCAGFGQGIDPQDKGAGKAMSYAVKYALLKMFSLETGDDPEKDNIDHVNKQQEADKREAEENRKKAESWVNDYLLKLEALDLTESSHDLVNLQMDNKSKLDKIIKLYPNLDKTIKDATDKVRGV